MNENMNRIIFKEDEKDALLDVLEQIKGKKHTNIYYFFDYRTRLWHIFHHTEQNAECQTGFEEAMYTILKTLGIKSYCIVMWKDDKVNVDRVFTNTGIHISNIDHNLDIGE